MRLPELVTIDSARPRFDSWSAATSRYFMPTLRLLMYTVRV